MLVRYPLAILLAIAAIACAAENDPPAPTQEDWLERHNRLAAMLQIIQAQAVNATAENPSAVTGLRDAVRGVTAQVDTALEEQSAGRQAPLATTTYAASATGPALFLYWNWKAPEATTLFPVLTRLRLQRPGVAIYHVHLQAPSDWQHFMLDFRQSALAADRDAELMGPVAAAQKWSWFATQLEPLQAAAAFDGTPGIAPFASVGSAITHRAGRIPTWRYRTQRGTVHALTGSGPHLDLSSWISRCEAWDEARAAEAADTGVPVTQAISAWHP